MTEIGVVLKVKDEFAQVRVGRNSACASCGKCGMTSKQKHVDFFASNAIGATAGDTVELEIPEGNSAKFALIAYFIPLAPALALLFLALGLKCAEWLAILLFFAGLAVGFAVLSVIDRVRKHKWMETPVITKIIHKNSTAAAENGVKAVENKQQDQTKGENEND